MLKIGFAQSDITPTMGRDLTGGFATRGRWPVHDPLLAVACVIDNNQTSIALVGTDTLIAPKHLTDAARQRIAQQTSIPAQNILIAASHTHQGGPLLTGLISQSDPRYENQVADAIVDATTRAWQSRRDARFAHATGRVAGLHFNRRFLMRDGKEVTHPGKLHPDIIRPAGPVDPDVSILAVRDGYDQNLGAVVTFACHATVVGGEEYSADYIHYIRRHLMPLLPGAEHIVFLPGASGDVTQVNNLAPGHDFGHELGDRIGAALAGECHRALALSRWHSDAELRAQSETVPIAIKPQRPIEEERPDLGLGSGEYWEKVFAREQEELAKLRAQTPVIPCIIQGLRIDDMAIVSNGAELFCQPALDIKSASPLKATWVISLANEYLGYIPTATAFYAGGYEPRASRTSFLAADAAQRIVQASLRVLNRL